MGIMDTLFLSQLEKTCKTWSDEQVLEAFETAAGDAAIVEILTREIESR